MALGKNCEPLNKTFCECLLKYIDILGRKGCNRTALEYCKLLLALSPGEDPYGVLLRFDFYAMRTKAYNLYIDFAKDFSREIYKQGTLMLMPNFMLSVALA